MPRVTTTQIAKTLGIAQPTVSTILNGSRSNTRVSQELREKVLKAAAELGYRPNGAAMAMKRGSFNAIGILSSTRGAQGMIPPLMLWAIQQELMQRDMHLMLGQMPDEKLTDDDELPRVLREWSVDGLLLSYTADMPSRMLELIRRYRIPAIHLNARLAHDCVRPDDEGAAARATRRCLELGHRRIAYVDHVPNVGDGHYSIGARRIGYELAMRDAGLTPRVIPGVQDYELQQHHELSAQLLDEPDRPSAVVCYTPARAKPLVYVAAHRGLVLGRDLSVITFSEARQEAVGPNRLDYMRTPSWGIGCDAVQMLLKKVESSGKPLAPKVLPFHEEHGDTVKAPASV